MGRSTVSHPKARHFGPAQAWHGPLHTSLGLARPTYYALARAASTSRRVARHGPQNSDRPVKSPLNPTTYINSEETLAAPAPGCPPPNPAARPLSSRLSHGSRRHPTAVAHMGFRRHPATTARTVAHLPYAAAAQSALLRCPAHGGWRPSVAPTVRPGAVPRAPPLLHCGRGRAASCPSPMLRCRHGDAGS